MHIRIILLVFLYTLLHSCNPAPSNPLCQKFHQGEFKYVDELFGDYLVTRSKDSQIEYNPKTNLKVEFGIKWKNDCTYKLKFKKILSNPGKLSLPSDIKDMVKTCKITEISKESYTEETSSNLNKTINNTVYNKLK